MTSGIMSPALLKRDNTGPYCILMIYVIALLTDHLPTSFNLFYYVKYCDLCVI